MKDRASALLGFLGELTKARLDVSNSFAIPFKDPKKVWFLDHNYLESIFRRINAREKIVGRYSTGPAIKPSDIEINEFFRRYVANPTLVVIM